MSNKDSLGDRMKSYEEVSSPKLVPRMPIIIRVDGKAFHTYTGKNEAEKPWDQDLIDTMWATAMILCKEVEGCQIGYIQSDEISLLLKNYQTIEQTPWFDNKVQKLCSITASIATAGFNLNKPKDWVGMALFDSRCFVLPKEEVCNYFIWRQQDATRNSIQMLAQSKFSQKKLNGKNQSEMQEMLFSDKGINWNNCNTYLKRGACVTKHEVIPFDYPQESPICISKESFNRYVWSLDDNIPIFTDDRYYIERYI
jgi:tRNA(His) guanylyltransferase